MDEVKGALAWTRAILVEKFVGMHRSIDTTIGMGGEASIKKEYIQKYKRHRELIKSFDDVINFFEESENGST